MSDENANADLLESVTEKAGPPPAKLPIAGILVGAAILAAGVGVLLVGVGRSGPDGEPQTVAAKPAERVAAPSERPREEPPASRERQTAIRMLGSWRSDAAEPLAEADAAAGRFEPAIRPQPPYDAVDSTLFDALDRRFRLVQAQAVPREEVCRDASGRRFACGLQGRASLQNHIVGKTVICRRLFLGDPDKTGIVDARCSVDGEDLALFQIRAGWAVPSGHADAEHRAAYEDARARRVGVWAGAWEAPVRDASEIDAREVPFGSLRLGEAGAKPAP